MTKSMAAYRCHVYRKKKTQPQRGLTQPQKEKSHLQKDDGWDFNGWYIY